MQAPAAGAGEEQGVPEPGGGDPVAVGARDALDEPVVAQPAEVIAELPAGHGLGGGAEQGCQVVAQVAAGEAAGQQAEDAPGRQQGLGPLAGEGHPGDALAGAGGDWAGDGGQGGGAVGGVAAESFYAE